MQDFRAEVSQKLPCEKSRVYAKGLILANVKWKMCFPPQTVTG